MIVKTPFPNLTQVCHNVAQRHATCLKLTRHTYVLLLPLLADRPDLGSAGLCLLHLLPSGKLPRVDWMPSLIVVDSYSSIHVLAQSMNRNFVAAMPGAAVPV
jgi:hypothetical protein